MKKGNTKIISVTEPPAPAYSPDDVNITRPAWQAVLLGLAAGTGGALIGVGGGIIMVPILTMWGHTQKRAQGTSLLVILAVSSIAIITYAIKGNIDFSFAIPLAIGGIVGGYLGSEMALRFSNELLGRLFSIFLILIALRLLFWEIPAEQADYIGLNISLNLTGVGLLGILGGTAAGFFGVGGGIVFVPVGVLLGGLTQGVAQGASLTAMLPTVLTSTANYWRKNRIDIKFALSMMPGAIIGGFIGALGADYLSKLEGSGTLTILFSMFLIITAIHRLITIGNSRKK